MKKIFENIFRNTFVFLIVCAIVCYSIVVIFEAFGVEVEDLFYHQQESMTQHVVEVVLPEVEHTHNWIVLHDDANMLVQHCGTCAIGGIVVKTENGDRHGEDSNIFINRYRRTRPDLYYLLLPWDRPKPETVDEFDPPIKVEETIDTDRIDELFKRVADLEIRLRKIERGL